MPVITQRTIAERVKLERLEAITIEAAEQCGRTLLPGIAQPVSLKQILDEHNPARRLYFADEAGGEPAAQAFEAGPALILTGPEGGFTAPVYSPTGSLAPGPDALTIADLNADGVPDMIVGNRTSGRRRRLRKWMRIGTDAIGSAQRNPGLRNEKADIAVVAA